MLLGGEGGLSWVEIIYRGKVKVHGMKRKIEKYRRLSSV